MLAANGPKHGNSVFYLLELILVWIRVRVSVTCVSAMKTCLHENDKRLLFQMALTVTNGIDCCKWHRLFQMASTVPNGIDCYKWHRLLQRASTFTSGTDCYKWYRLLQMALTVYKTENCFGSMITSSKTCAVTIR